MWYSELCTVVGFRCKSVIWLQIVSGKCKNYGTFKHSNLPNLSSVSQLGKNLGYLNLFHYLKVGDISKIVGSNSML